MLARWFGRRTELAALVMRLAVGMVFLVHGYLKMFALGLEGTVNLFRTMGVPAPELFGPLVAFVEFFGGIALVLGLFSRYVALMLAVLLVVAILKVKLPLGLIAQNACGYELDVALLAGALALLVLGPGALSLERALFAEEL